MLATIAGLLPALLAMGVMLAICLPVAALAWVIVRVLPGVRDTFVRWYSVPARPLIAGIVFAVLFIQIVMRQCLAFNDLLLAADLPKQPPWFRAILLAGDDIPMNLFVVLLLLGVAVTAACGRVTAARLALFEEERGDQIGFFIGDRFRSFAWSNDLEPV